MRHIFPFLLALAIVTSCCHTKDSSLFYGSSNENRHVIAYVTAWQEDLPNPTYLTCINYAFGHVNQTFDGVEIENPRRLAQIVAIKQLKPTLKVVLSIGGWGSGRFSEMAADPVKRLSFTKDCKRVMDQYGLDGIDFDWEYPGQNAAGISASPDDEANYTLLCRDTREAIGKDAILSQATVCTAKYIDFKAVDKYMNYHNIMSYDMGIGTPGMFNSALYRSERVGAACTHEAVLAHIEQGIDPSKIVMGLAFYGRGKEGFPAPADMAAAQKRGIEGYVWQWDDVAKNPYFADPQTGELVFGYEDLESIAIKASYAVDNGLAGVMYWSYDGDNKKGDFRRTVYEILNPQQ